MIPGNYNKRIGALILFFVAICATLSAQERPLASIARIKGVTSVVVGPELLESIPASQLASTTGLSESEAKNLKMVELLTVEQRSVIKDVLGEFEKLKKPLGLKLVSSVTDDNTQTDVYQGRTADRKYPLIVAVVSEKSSLVITAVVGDVDVSRLTISQ